ncbi:YncE family protein [Dolosigranulum pigrum]|uniref:YncE family protein n=1 Tax=Dolosigranulum pigrum TaxID=29394 RepID=UPI001FCBEED6|nr:YncE family protein [Dolosigranulum pigrum]
MKKYSVMLLTAGLLMGCSHINHYQQALNSDSNEADSTQSSTNVTLSEDTVKQTDTAEQATSKSEEELEQETTLPSSTTQLELVDILEGHPITPKSIVSNGQGKLLTNNMMYSHNVTLFDAETLQLDHVLSDSVDFSAFDVPGYEDYVGEIAGAPVEAVWTDDGQYAYVSNYSLAGVGASADDNCSHGDAITPSVVYRYSLAQQDWDQVIPVGRVPKYVALSPDQSKLLVSNWCDNSLSVIDTKTTKEIMQIPLNTFPRGIVVLPDNETAYVTAMYAHEVYRVNLSTGEHEVAFATGDYSKPRHLVLSPDGKTVYLTLSAANELWSFDAASGEILQKTATGLEPRTMEISEDGTALYVVNYDEATMSKFDANSLEEIQHVDTHASPIGVTYDQTTDTVWVANYNGTLHVFDDTAEQSTN